MTIVVVAMLLLSSLWTVVAREVPVRSGGNCSGDDLRSMETLGEKNGGLHIAWCLIINITTRHNPQRRTLN